MPFWLRVSIELFARAILILSGFLLFGLVSYWLVMATFLSAWFNQWTALPFFSLFIFWLVGWVLGVGWLWKAIGIWLDRADGVIWQRYDRQSE